MSVLDTRLGLWTDDNQSALGHLHDIQALGFEWLAVRAVYHPSLGPPLQTQPFQPDAVQQLVKDAATISFPIIAWAYLYPDNIDEQIQVIRQSLPAGCTDLLLDAESEWEQVADPQTRDDTAQALAHGLAEATGHTVALHLSSFYAPDLHPDFPFTAFLAHCQSFMPQSYVVGGTPADLVLQRTLQQSLPLAAATLGKQVIPTVNVPEMLGLVNRPEFGAANVWLWDTAGGDLGVQDSQAAWSAAIAA